jgi:SNF2 family DNA or RNA helicase
MEIIDNKALLLRVKEPGRITTVIPKSRELPNNQVVVRWGLDEAQVLRNLKIKNVPSPILGQYDWPGQYRPFDHQRTTAAFLTLNRKAFCLNEQGTGKTGSVIWAADYLMKHDRIRRVLVICPLSIMDSAWRADLFKFAMHRTVDIAYGAADKRRAIIRGHAEFVIINFDGVEIVADEIARAGFDLIVVDEANAYKNAQTKRWKVLNSLVKPETWLWMLTGTPAAQSPVDAYGLAKLVNPTGVPKFFTTFKEMVMTKMTQFRWIPKENATQTVVNALQPAIRYTKDECLDLPEMVYVKRKVELTKQQQKYYDLLKNKMIIQAAGEEITSVNAAVNMSKLLQISCGAVYADTGEAVEFDIKNRYAVLKEVIEESSQKVLVFVPFKHAIDILTQKLLDDGIPAEIIRGDVSPAKRTDIFKRFQETPNPQVLVIQPQSAAHGVTLTAANTVVWWGPTSSLETYAQANARVHRSGQKHHCTVVQLYGSGVEKHVYTLLDNKIDVHTKIVELYKEILA